MGLNSLISPSSITGAAPLFADVDSVQQNAVCAAACQIADKYVGRNLVEENAVEYYDGSLNSYLNLKRWPITTLTEVRWDLTGGYGQPPSSFGSTTILTLGTDFYCDYARGILQIARNWASGGDWFSRGYRAPTVSGRYGVGLVASYIPASWGQVLGSVKVTYTAGYTASTLPRDIVSAVAQIAMYLVAINETGGLQKSANSFIDVSETFQKTTAIDELRGGLPAFGTARQILDQYRAPVVGTGWVLG